MKLTPTPKRIAVGLLAAALPLSMAACAKGGSSSSGGAGGELTMWTHNAGNKAELAANPK
ncbi:MAG: sugar ABC transporter substrate-binding protein, partial [Dermatophilaceae bacterium]|nr:sugar ABC transporter substrate-binding protein [Dermatophilaceae bacterium]